MESVAKPIPHPEVGTELVREWIPEGEPKATIVLVHGLAEHCGRYERTGGLLAEAGFHVRSFDLIGAGGTGGKRGHIEDWSHYLDQIQNHVGWARDQGKPVVLFGHSMGGNLALGYATSDLPRPDLVIASAPALAGGAAWQKALAPLAARLVPNAYMPNGLKGEQLSRDPEVGEKYFADPLVHPKTSMKLGAELFGAIDEVKEAVTELDVETLVIHGGADSIVPPQSSAFLAEIPCVDRRLYPQLRHELLNEPEGPEVVADVIDWINQHL